MKGAPPTETPPSYVESVGPSRPARPVAQPGDTTGSFQPHQDESTPLSPGRASTSSDSSSTHASSFFWGRKKGKEKEKHHRHDQEKEGTSAERKEFERRQRKNEVSPTEAATAAYVSRIPPEAQKALAPLTVSTDSKDIVGAYSIELSSTIAYAQAANGTTAVSPTCKFTSSSRNDIDVTLFFRPAPPKPGPNGGPPLPARVQNDVPLEILANNKKGKIKLSIPHRLPGRPLRVICSLEGGQTTLVI